MAVKRAVKHENKRLWDTRFGSTRSKISLNSRIFTPSGARGTGEGCTCRSNQFRRFWDFLPAPLYQPLHTW